MKIPLTVVKNFYCGVIRVKVDVNLYGFKSGEIYLIEPKYAKIINENEWKAIINKINTDIDEFNKKMQNIKKSKDNKKKLKKYRKNKFNNSDSNSD